MIRNVLLSQIIEFCIAKGSEYQYRISYFDCVIIMKRQRREQQFVIHINITAFLARQNEEFTMSIVDPDTGAVIPADFSVKINAYVIVF